MPAPELIGRYQSAVLWPITSRDGYGQPVVDRDNPVELRVRWDGTRVERVDRDGNTIVIDATVITDRSIAIGSLLWQGSLDDLPGTGLVPEEDVMVVKFSDDQPDLKNRHVAHSVMLMKFKDTLS